MTARGASVVGSGLALLLSWVVLGEIELLAAATAMLVAVLLALILTRFLRPLVGVTRQLEPTMVQEGDMASVALQIENRRELPAFGLTIKDGVSGLGTATFRVGSLPPNRTATAAYQIVCRPRGIYSVGPTEIEVRDPLGLASASVSTGITDRLIVYPNVEALAGFPNERGRDPATSASRPEHSQRGGEDFYTLRSYQDGDDLRRVHWPSSARLDELMIRQMETPWQSRALVFFDVRRTTYESKDAFERAVRGAASVAAHLGGAFAADMWMGGGLIDLAHPALAFEALAEIQPLPAVDLRAVASRLLHVGKGGALALITGRPDEDLLAVVRLLHDRYRAGVMLCAADDPGEGLAPIQRIGIRTIVTGAEEKWAPAWANALGPRTWVSASA